MSIHFAVDNFSGSLRQPAAPAPGGAIIGASHSGTATASGDSNAAAAGNAATAFAEPTSTLPDTTPQLSAGFSVLVVQVLNTQGKVVSTTPTAQQLAAYRNGSATPPG